MRRSENTHRSHAYGFKGTAHQHGNRYLAVSLLLQWGLSRSRYLVYRSRHGFHKWKLFQLTNFFVRKRIRGNGTAKKVSTKAYSF